jgi:hypothetical protein
MGISNIKVEPMIVSFGEDRAQIENITVTAAGSGVAGKYFILQDSSNARFAVWLDDGVATAPVVAGATLVPVSYLISDSVSQLAAKIAFLVGALTAFNATSSGAVVQVTHTAIGYAPQAHDSYTTPLKTGYVFEIEVLGSALTELGCLDGDIEVSNEAEYTDITCHATGDLVVAKLLKNISNEVSLTMQETNVENLKKVITIIGGSYLPSGAAPTELLGVGTGGFGKNLFGLAQPLTLHPKRKVAADKSGDYRFWKAVPVLESITFSGSESLKFPLVFSVFPDDTKPEQINIFSVGDWSQI